MEVLAESPIVSLVFKATKYCLDVMADIQTMTFQCGNLAIPQKT